MSQSKFHIIVSATAGNSIYPPIFFHLADLESWGWLESQLPLLHFHVWLSLCHSIRRYSICITADAVPISHATLPSLVNKTLRYLNYSTWDSKSFPTQINRFTLFWMRARTQTWRLWFSFQPFHIRLQTSPVQAGAHSLMELTEPRAKSRYATLRPQILSINRIDRIGDKGEPQRAFALTGNESRLWPAVWPKLSLQFVQRLNGLMPQSGVHPGQAASPAHEIKTIWGFPKLCRRLKVKSRTF